MLQTSSCHLSGRALVPQQITFPCFCVGTPIEDRYLFFTTTTYTFQIFPNCVFIPTSIPYSNLASEYSKLGHIRSIIFNSISDSVQLSSSSWAFSSIVHLFHTTFFLLVDSSTHVTLHSPVVTDFFTKPDLPAPT